MTDTFLTRVARPDDGACGVVTLEPRNGSTERVFEAEALLLAAGRRPNVEGLELDRVGVEWTHAGVVDERIADVGRRDLGGRRRRGGDPADAGCRLPGAGRGRGHVRRRPDDGLHAGSHLDLHRSRARGGRAHGGAGARQGLRHRTVTYAAQDILRPYYTLPRDASAVGLVKLVYERGSRRILGLHVVVRGGGELVQGWAFALGRGVTVDDVAYGHHAFPTVGEAVHYATDAVLAEASVA